MKISIEVATQDVADLIVTGMEGGFSPWLGSYKYVDLPDAEIGAPAYAFADFYDKGGKLRFKFDGPGDPEGSFKSVKVVGLPEIEAALDKMANEYPSHAADFLVDSADATTGDVFLQLLCLGDIIYG